MAGDPKIKIGKMTEAKHAFVKWLINEDGVDPKLLDVDRLGEDGVISFEEAATYSLKGADWQRYLERLEKIDPSIKHPLDTRNLSPDVRERIADFGQQARFKTELVDGFTPDSAERCELALQNFFDLGDPSFGEGGLCLGYRSEDALIEKVTAEMTAVEAFENCARSKDTGTCTEHTYMKMVAAGLEFPECPLDFVSTQGHVYPAYNGVAFDASELGNHGWHSIGSAVATYYKNRGSSVTDTRIASLIDPAVHFDDITFRNFIMAGELEKALFCMDEVVSKTPLNINPFIVIFRAMDLLGRDQAEELALGALHRWPDSPYALTPTMNLLYLHKNMNDPYVPHIFDRLRSEFPTKGYDKALQAVYHYMNQRYDKAEEILADLPANRPNDIFKQYLFANIYLFRGELDRAEATVKDALELAPNFPGLHFTLAQIHRLKGRLKDALAEVGEEKKVFRNNLEGILLEADINMTLGRPEKALDTLTGLYNRGHDDAMIFSYSARASLMMGRLAAAKEWMQTAKGLGVNEDWMLAAEIAFFENDVTAAEQAIEMITIDINRKFMESYLALYKNDLEKADTKLKELEATVKGGDLSTERAFLQLRKGNITEARHMFEARLHDNEYDFVAITGMVWCDIIMGDRSSAWGLLERLKTSFPSVYDYKPLPAMALWRGGFYTMAIAKADELLKANPHEKTAHWIKAFAFLEMDDFDDAMDEITVYDKMYPYDKASYYYVMAKAHLGLGEFEKALEFARLVEGNAQGNYTWPLDDLPMLEDMINY